jgi:hypothetical protein
MKNIGILLMAMMILMVSCSKEESLETGGSGGSGGGGGTGGGSSSGALLTKLVTTGVQTTTQDFFYDSKKQLVKYVNVNSTPGSTANITLTITRDANGRVAKIVQDMPASATAPASSSPTTFVYQGPTDTKVKYSIATVDVGGGFGIIVRDSSVYEYTSNNLTKLLQYYSFDDGASYDPTGYVTFRYDSRGNIIEQISYADLGGGLEPIQKTISEYDNKPSACDLNDDAFAGQILSIYLSPNNITKQTIDLLVAGQKLSVTAPYQYRSDGKPSKVTGNALGGSFQSTYTYK